MPYDKEGFKLIRVDQTTGVDNNQIHIACIESRKNLVIGMFNIAGRSLTAIIDTGATASFIADMNPITDFLQPFKISVDITVNTANETQIKSNSAYVIDICPTMMPDRRVTVKLYTLPQRTEIMGHPLVLG